MHAVLPTWPLARAQVQQPSGILSPAHQRILHRRHPMVTPPILIAVAVGVSILISYSTATSCNYELPSAYQCEQVKMDHRLEARMVTPSLAPQELSTLLFVLASAAGFASSAASVVVAVCPESLVYENPMLDRTRHAAHDLRLQRLQLRSRRQTPAFHQLSWAHPHSAVHRHLAAYIYLPIAH